MFEPITLQTSYSGLSQAKESTLDELSPTQVGEPWPDLEPGDVHWPEGTGASFRFYSVKTPNAITHSLTLSFGIKARFCFFALLAVIVGFAVWKNDRPLLEDVLKVISGTEHSHSATESPPRI